jgi:type IV pilus assembly protein PilN
VINVNLLPKEERSIEPRALTPPRTKFLVPLAAAIAVLVPVGTLFVHQETRLQSLERDIQLAEQETATLRPRVARVQELEQRRDDLLRRLDLVHSLNQERTLTVRLLDELAHQVPANLWLTRMTPSGTSAMTLEGITFTPIVLSDLMRSLDESRMYRNVDLTVAERTQIGDQKVVKFTITASVDPEAGAGGR